MTMSSRALALAAVLALAPAARPQEAPVERTPPIAPKIQETPLPPAIVVPPPAVVPADVPNRSLTADEAVRVALAHQAGVTVAAGSLEAAAGRAQQARSGLLPAINLSSAYTNVDVLSGTGASSGAGGTGGTGSTGGTISSSTGYLASASLRQLVFDFNHTRETVREAAALQRAARHNLTRVQSDLAFQVKQAFYGFVQEARLVAVNEGNLRNQNAHLALAEARLKAGVGLPSDVVTAQTAIAEATLNLTVARNNASLARVALAVLMGLDPRTPIDAAESTEPPVPMDVDALVETALRERPDVLQAASTVEAASAGVRAARTSGSPALSATAGLAARANAFPLSNQSFTVGGSIQWPIFDAGLTSGRVREARANHTVASAQADLARQGAAADAVNAWLNLRSSEQRAVTADAEVANAEEAVRLNEGRYRAGLGTFIEVTDAQTALLTARTNRVNAQAAVNQARAAVQHAIGAPIP